MKCKDSFSAENSINRCDFEHIFPSESVKKIFLSAFGGNVIVRGKKDSQEIFIKIQWCKNRPHLQPKVLLKNSSIQILANQWLAFFNQKNEYIIEIETPPHIEIQLKLGAGTLFIENMEATTHLKLRVGSINGSLESCKNTINVGIGSVSLQLKNQSDQTNVSINVGIGDVLLGLTATQQKNTPLKHKNGFIKNSAQAKIKTFVGLGDIKTI